MAPKGPKGDPDDRGPKTTDDFGIGVMADGRVNVLTLEEALKQKAERDAEEELDGEQDPEQEEDFADLMPEGE